MLRLSGCECYGCWAYRTTTVRGRSWRPRATKLKARPLLMEAGSATVWYLQIWSAQRLLSPLVTRIKVILFFEGNIINISSIFTLALVVLSYLKARFWLWDVKKGCWINPLGNGNYPGMTDPTQAELNSCIGDVQFCFFTVFPSWGEVYPWRKLIMRTECSHMKREGYAEKKTTVFPLNSWGGCGWDDSSALRQAIKKWFLDCSIENRDMLNILLLS